MVMQSDGRLPRSLLVNGREIPVTWESLGTTVDDSGHTLELFAPVFPLSVLTPAFKEAIFDQIKVWDVTDNTMVDLAYNERKTLTSNERKVLEAKVEDGSITPEEQELLDLGYREIYHPARETLANIGLESGENLSPEIAYEEGKFQSIRQDLVYNGKIDPSLLEIPEVEDFILQQSNLQQGERVDESFLRGLRLIMQGVQKNPSQAKEILAQYAPSKPEQPMTKQEAQVYNEKQRASAQRTSAPMISARAQEKTFGTELEYQQNLINTLQPQAQQLRQQYGLGEGQYLTTGGPAEMAVNEVLKEFDVSNQRVAEIGAGDRQKWTPETLAEIEAENIKREEEIAKRPKPKSNLDIEYERLLNASRRAQRVTRL